MDKIEKVLEIISGNKLDAALISSVSNIIFLTGFSGFSHLEREAFLLISKKKNYIITDGRYSEAVSKIPHFELLEISHKNSLEDIFKLLSNKINRLGVEEDDISLSESKKFKKYFKLISLKDLENLRVVKEESEVLKIKKACQIGDEAFNFILKKIKSGITEKELAFEIEMFIKKSGADISFPPIVAFGKNSSIPHHQTGDTKLSKDQIVLLDFGVKFENYCSDMTRTVFLGKADDKFKKIYNTVLKSQELTIKMLIDYSLRSTAINKKLKAVVRSRSTDPKILNASNLDNVARQYIIRSGYPTIPHSLGHGIGIEVHESPRLSPKSKDILKPGMVFSIEPGIYIPNYGGIRIEDLVTIQKNKPELLTHSPKNLIEI